ncbi:MAG TPA: hypothetical protein VHS31_02000 [Tepidisphaeraceae bacterium]|jgi:pyruvate/2-oxoglutarate dehydrogenase complex dihydrolipoamide dehydrogenase (E3) component|nr:hypothetical protein [Tepidisphaeraceae bacterium]
MMIVFWVSRYRRRGGEVMSVVQTAMLGGMPYTTLRNAIFAHPTLAEGLNRLFANPPQRP